MTPVLPLPQRLDGTTAATLREVLLAHRGRDVCLDISPVARVGTLALQVLLAARLSWQADGAKLMLKGENPQFDEKLSCIGLDRGAFETAVS